MTEESTPSSTQKNALQANATSRSKQFDAGFPKTSQPSPLAASEPVRLAQAGATKEAMVAAQYFGMAQGRSRAHRLVSGP